MNHEHFKKRPSLIIILLVLLCSASICASYAEQPNSSLSITINSVLNEHGITRCDSTNQLDANTSARRSYTYNSILIQPGGNGYLIVTDQSDPASLASLARLANFHNGKLIRFEDFCQLPINLSARVNMFNLLKEQNPRYLAIAPRIQSFKENVVLAFWQILTNYGGGHITVYQAFLVAPDNFALESLVKQATERPPDFGGAPMRSTVFAQSTTEEQGGTRAIAKAAVVEDLFRQLNIDCQGAVIRSLGAPPTIFPKVASLGYLSASNRGPAQFLSPLVQQSIANSRLLLFFGHGLPGMSCSVSVDAFRQTSFYGDTVLCGSCYSCYPLFSDLPPMQVLGTEPFFARAIANGARVFYGHMRENDGFPPMFVVLESLMNGESVGQSYQRILNVLIANAPVPRTQFILPINGLGNRNAVEARNSLLLIMIGDPADHPVGLFSRQNSATTN